MAKAFKVSDKVNIENKLLDAGEFLFIKFGLEKTTIEDLTKLAGIGKGTFYNFYNSKIDLYLDLYKRQREKLVGKVDKSFMNRKESVDYLITEYLNTLATLLSKDDILTMVYSQEVMAVLYSKGAEKQLEEFNNSANKELSEIIMTWEKVKTSNKNLNSAVIAGMIRSITFLRFHKFYIGENIYDDVVGGMITAISSYIT